MYPASYSRTGKISAWRRSISDGAGVFCAACLDISHLQHFAGEKMELATEEATAFNSPVRPCRSRWDWKWKMVFLANKWYYSKFLHGQTVAPPERSQGLERQLLAWEKRRHGQGRRFVLRLWVTNRKPSRSERAHALPPNPKQLPESARKMQKNVLCGGGWPGSTYAFM